MKVLLYSDPHIGQVRRANSTPDSTSRREQYNRVLLRALLLDKSYEVKVCLGDFFDQESNPEDVILAGLSLAEVTDLILAGNHDISNRAGKESSLRLVQEVYPNRVLIADPAEPDGFSVDLGGTLFCFAPHALTQAAYDGIIAGLVEDADEHEGMRVLCLHCNYALPEAFGSENVLNLTEVAAVELLGHFHTILIGHVHTPADYFDGRLKLIGSVFPTAFDNLERKRVLEYDTETYTFSERTTWDPDQKLARCNASELGVVMSTVDHFDLFDDLPPGEAQKLVVKLFKSGAFGVRLRRPEAPEQGAPKITKAQFDRLPEVIEAEIAEARPHLLPVWKEMRGLVE